MAAGLSPAEDGKRHRKKDGTLIDVEIVSHALVFDGRPARLVLAHDVTDQRRAEEALRQSETNLARAQAIAQMAPERLETVVEREGMMPVVTPPESPIIPE